MSKLDDIFCEVFNVEPAAFGADFSKSTVACWDSVRQLALATALEQAFDILLDPEDIMGCTSYLNVRQIVIKYGIEL